MEEKYVSRMSPEWVYTEAADHLVTAETIDGLWVFVCKECKGHGTEIQTGFDARTIVHAEGCHKKIDLERLDEIFNTISIDTAVGKISAIVKENDEYPGIEVFVEANNKKLWVAMVENNGGDGLAVRTWDDTQDEPRASFEPFTGEEL